jgi:hypothetical protein
MVGRSEGRFARQARAKSCASSLIRAGWRSGGGRGAGRARGDGAPVASEVGSGRGWVTDIAAESERCPMPFGTACHAGGNAQTNQAMAAGGVSGGGAPSWQLPAT